MAGVELDPLELLGVGAARGHERQRAVDLAGHLLVALAGRACRATKSWFQACTWRRSA